MPGSIRLGAHLSAAGGIITEFQDAREISLPKLRHLMSTIDRRSPVIAAGACVIVALAASGSLRLWVPFGVGIRRNPLRK